jgi:hypothetical protein
MIRRLEGSAIVASSLWSLETSSVFPLLQVSRVRDLAVFQTSSREAPGLMNTQGRIRIQRAWLSLPCEQFACESTWVKRSGGSSA